MKSIKNIDELQELYNIYEIISSESRSDIYRARDIRDNKEVVIKSSHKRYALNELNFFKDVMKEKHPNIIHVYDSFEDDGCAYIILEYANAGDLLGLCKDHRLLSENHIRNFFKQIVEGTRYIHSLKYFHGDLKPENILLFRNVADETFTLKITDFEFSRSYREDMLIKTMRGTLNYAAPEILCRESFIGPEIDIWALGIILYIMTFKTQLFDHPVWDNITVEVYQEIFRNFSEKGFNLNRVISYELHNLLTGMLIVNRENRFKMDEIISSAWMQSN